MAPPGNTANHGFSDRKFCASLSMSPHDGCGGCVPSPRYASPASARMATGKLVVAWMISGASVLGRMWRTMRRRSPAPERPRGHHELAVAQLEERWRG